MRRLVLHDYFESADGGGRLALTLAKEINADICYGFKVHNHPYFQIFDFHDNQHPLIPFTSIPVWRQFLLSEAFKRKTRFQTAYDTIVYSGSYAPLAVGNHTASRNIYYCHTPPRFLYDQCKFYLSSIPVWQRPVLNTFRNYFQPRYEQAVRQMDVILTNSQNVRQRIQKYLDLDAIVVYPPCETDKFQWIGQEDFFLSMARLDSLKRVDRVIQAFCQMPEKKLVVVSDGPESTTCRAMAHGVRNIEIRGRVPDQELIDLLGRCIGTIYIPKDEDFGMSPVESMAAGKPVIGVAEGGMLETVIDGKTGLLLNADPTVSEIREAVNHLDHEHALIMRKACEAQARMFRKDLFIERMKEIIF